MSIENRSRDGFIRYQGLKEIELTVRRDIELRRRVQAELDWEPDLKQHEIGLAVTDGVVTVWGQVGDTKQKHVARAAVLRVSGVEVVADEVRVRSDDRSADQDTEIAHAVHRHLMWHLKVPQDSVKATVAQGWITLEGEVDLPQQRVDAERGLRRIQDVQGVTNQIHVGGFGDHGSKRT